MKNYRAQTPQNLALTKILQKFRKTSTPLENRKAFSSQGKSWNFEQTGKVRENHTKYWNIQGISDKCFLLFFSDI